jgi:hypothetical protein
MHNLRKEPARGLAAALFFCAAGASLAFLSSAPSAYAESAYIQQVGNGSGGDVPVPNSGSNSPWNSSGASNDRPSYLTAVPTHLAQNIAQTLTIGRSNQVAQFQTGVDDTSNVSILGGARNEVGVLQSSGDTSNIGLLGTAGLNFDVIQPPGAAPLNMLVARIPGHGYLTIIGR